MKFLLSPNPGKLTITFDGDISAFAVHLGRVSGDLSAPWGIEAKNSLGISLGSQVGPSFSDTNSYNHGFTIGWAGSGIRSIELFAASYSDDGRSSIRAGGGDILLDNLHWVNAASSAPEPASYALFLIGLGAISLLRRHRQG